MNDPQPMLSVTNLPPLFRITRLTLANPSAMVTMSEATLYHATTELNVSWPAKQSDRRLQDGNLVSVRVPITIDCAAGDLQVRRIVSIQRPVRGVDLFQTIPPTWVTDQALLDRATALWQNLGSGWRELFNHVFWDGERFRKFCEGPGSVRGHHSCRNGNLQHMVETAEAALALLPQHPSANPDVVLAAALLHDVGKAVEYEPTRSGWKLSDSGQLIGHKLTTLEWIAVAESRMSEPLQRREYMALRHAIGSASGVTFESGYREARTPEAKVLSLADQSSGSGNLYSRVCSPNGGWGRVHAHLGNTAPYSLPWANR